jgi:hypothetical protein
LLDNDIQRITNCVRYSQLLRCMACLYDAETDTAIDSLLTQHNHTFAYMHSSAQACHMTRVTALYHAMVLDRLQRVLGDTALVTLMQQRYPRRLEYLRQAAVALGDATINDDMIHTIALIISVMVTKRGCATVDAARFVRLCGRLTPPNHHHHRS